MYIHTHCFTTLSLSIGSGFTGVVSISVLDVLGVVSVVLGVASAVLDVLAAASVVLNVLGVASVVLDVLGAVAVVSGDVVVELTPASPVVLSASC